MPERNENSAHVTPIRSTPTVNSRINCFTATDDIFTAHQPDATQISEALESTDKDTSELEAITSAVSPSNVVVMLHGRVLERPPLPSPLPRANRSATPVRVAHDPLQRERRRRSESKSPVRLRPENQTTAPATRSGHLVENFEDLADEHRRLNLTRRPLFDGDSMRTVSALGRLGFPRLIRLRRFNVGFMRPPVNNNAAADDNLTLRDAAATIPPPPPPLPRYLNHPLSPPVMLENNSPFFHPFGGIHIAEIQNDEVVGRGNGVRNAAANGTNNNNRAVDDETNDENRPFSIRRINEHCIIS